MKTKYEIFLQWSTKFFSLESSASPTLWILPKLYEFCESCRRKSLETLKEFSALEIHVLVNMLLCSSHFTQTHQVYIGT